MSKTVKISDESYNALNQIRQDDDNSLSELLNKIIKWWLEKKSIDDGGKTESESLKREKNISDSTAIEILKRLNYLQEDQREILTKVTENNAKLYGKNGVEKFDSDNVEDKEVDCPILPRKKGKEVMVRTKYYFLGNGRWSHYIDIRMGILMCGPGYDIGAFDFYHHKIGITTEWNGCIWYHFDGKDDEEMMREVERRINEKYENNCPDFFLDDVNDKELIDTYKKINREREEKGMRKYEWYTDGE